MLIDGNVLAKTKVVQCSDTGRTTFVYLPSKWLKMAGYEPGDDIPVFQHAPTDALVILPKALIPKKEEPKVESIH